MSSSPDETIEVVPLHVLGAEVTGLSLTQAISASTAQVLRVALARYQLLWFRQQTLSAEAQVRLTRCFGDLEPGIPRRPENHRVPGSSDVLYLSNAPGSPTIEYGMAWHSDGLAYARVPHGATVLQCIACPPHAGDTLFADQYAAFEALPTALRHAVRGLFWYLPDVPHSEVPDGQALAHPVVRTHPETGREFVFCSPSASRVRGLGREDGARLLEAVHQVQVRPELIYRHRWTVGDVVVWENCTLLHNRADSIDYATQGLRVMHRSATSGQFKAISCEAATD